MFLFILIKKPFDEAALNYSNLLTELILCIIIPIFACFLFEISTTTKERIGYLMMVLINLIVGSQLAASVFIFAKTLRLKIKMMREKKVNIRIQPVEEGKEECFGNDEMIGKNFVSPAMSGEFKDIESIIGGRSMTDQIFLDSHAFCSPSRSLKFREKQIKNENLLKLFEESQNLASENKKTSTNLD